MKAIFDKDHNEYSIYDDDGAIRAHVYEHNDAPQHKLARKIIAVNDLLAACEMLVRSEDMSKGDANELARSWDVLAEATSAARAAIEKTRVE